LILDSNAEVNVPSGSENNIPLTLACWKGIENWCFSFNTAILIIVLMKKYQ